MKRSEIKNLIISSLDANSASGEIARQLEDEGVSYDFSEGFSGRVIEKILCIGAGSQPRTGICQKSELGFLSYCTYRSGSNRITDHFNIPDGGLNLF